MKDWPYILDSGAFSAWTQGKKIDIDKYANFCLEHIDKITYMVNLDVIPGRFGEKYVKSQEVEASAAQGWKNYEYLLSRGLPHDRLLPVFHQGENFSWLKRMVEEGIPYIGISPANDRTTREKIIWLDKCMVYALDNIGYPLLKFHGFGVTAVSILRRYPWFSCDSISWYKQAIVGKIMVPARKVPEGGGYDFTTSYWSVVVSSRAQQNKDPRYSGEEATWFSLLSPKKRFYVEEYIEYMGYSMGRARGDSLPKRRGKWVGEKATEEEKEEESEEILEPGITNSIYHRASLNLEFFLNVIALLPPWPWCWREKQSNSGFGFGGKVR